MDPLAPDVIRKQPDGRLPYAVVRDWGTSRATFTWQQARRGLDGLPKNRGLNIAHEAVDRWAKTGKIALDWLAKRGGRREVSYALLSELTSRFANVLRTLGVGPGDVVASLLGRVPELYVVCLGSLKNKSVFCPLFSQFGPEPIHSRLELGGARVLVTTPSLYQKKVAPIRASLPKLEHVLLAHEPGGPLAPGTAELAVLLRQASPKLEIPPTAPTDPALLHFTSGTTGRPKGALHVHGAVVAHHATAAMALDLHEGDVFWCTADPGWVTGTSYGVIAPLTHGATLIVDEDELEPERWYRTLAEKKVNVWYTAPTAVRMLMKAGDALPKRFDLSSLRLVASVGEPLNPEAVRWGQRALGQPIHDNWWQTETGGIMISNLRSMDVKPGSMGRPLPGVEAAVVRVSDGEVTVLPPGVEGELALKPGWPSMFAGYLNEPERYAKCFKGGWYLSGDLARVDSDGYFWFVGRADDMIKSAGHLIGPFEVESALLEHPAVAEAAVIGKPDATVGSIVKAFVSLKAGFEPGEALTRELLAHARKRLGPVVAPKELAVLPSLPRTRSGKILRRLLRARELGLPEGDTSTLEGGA